MPTSTPSAAGSRTRRLIALTTVVVAVGGGGAWWLASMDEDAPASASAADTPRASTGDTRFAGLTQYVDEHTKALDEHTGALVRAADSYRDVVQDADGDYRVVASTHADEARTALVAARAAWQKANPAYEEMEGVVAGVPSLAKYDVSIDAGAPADDDPENAVDFDVRVSKDRVLERPGNYFLLSEATLYGTEEAWSSGTLFDVDGDGSTTDLGDALPDADVLAAVARDFHAEAGRLRDSATKWAPTETDAFTAMVVMTPTMGEYFNSWKSSRFVAGNAATERGFAASSRLTDVVGILGGLEVIREALEPRMTTADPAASRSVEADLAALSSFVTDLRDREAAGTHFTAEQADRYGADAQEQAQQIAGRVTDMARQLGVEVQA